MILRNFLSLLKKPKVALKTQISNAADVSNNNLSAAYSLGLFFVPGTEYEPTSYRYDSPLPQHVHDIWKDVVISWA